MKNTTLRCRSWISQRY